MKFLALSKNMKDSLIHSFFHFDRRNQYGTVPERGLGIVLGLTEYYYSEYLVNMHVQ